MGWMGIFDDYPRSCNTGAESSAFRFRSDHFEFGTCSLCRCMEFRHSSEGICLHGCGHPAGRVGLFVQPFSGQFAKVFLKIFKVIVKQLVSRSDIK